MKIVLIGGQAIPGIGGVESYILNMSKALRDLGHEVIIICSNRQSFTASIDGIEIVHMISPKSNTVALPILFLKALSYIFKKRKSIDVVNFQSIYLAFLSGWITRLLGIKVYYTIHSLAEDNPKHGRFMRSCMKILAMVSIWCCGKDIITISHSKAEVIRQRYGRRCSVIPCGVNLPVGLDSSDIIQRFNLKRGYYYLTIGRIDPIKNLDILIEAYIKHDNPDYQLVIAGPLSSSYSSYLQNIANGHSNIIFVGGVCGADKECLLKNCFVNCLVSSSEGMPISLLEAMSYGKSCIVSDIDAIKEVMQMDWAMWCRVRDVESIVVQMCKAETHYDETIKHNTEMTTYVASHHTWNSIAVQYVNKIQ